MYPDMFSKIDRLRTYTYDEVVEIFGDRVVMLEEFFPHHEVGENIDELINRTLSLATKSGLEILYTPDYQEYIACGVFSSANNLLWVKSTTLPGIRFQAAVHELAHALHFSQDKFAYSLMVSRISKETVAHTVEYLVLDHFGIDTSFDSGLFLGAYWKADDTDIMDNAPTAIKIAEQIIKGIEALAEEDIKVFT